MRFIESGVTKMSNEKRLIDANPIVKFIVDGLNNPDKLKALGHDAIEVLAEIEYAPTVDAVEVVHAHWDNNGICTMCGYPIPTDSKYDFIDKDDCLFCYHCGAKMDLED